MRRHVITTLCIFLFVSFTFASDPPSETIGSCYTLSVYGGTGNDFTSTVLNAGDDDTHPCAAQLNAYCYGGTGLLDIAGYASENETPMCFCLVRHQGYNIQQWYEASQSNSVFLDSDYSYSLNIEIINGNWGAIYQLNIHEPANGNGSD